MARGLEYRRLIHKFFDGEITRAGLKEAVMALRTKQMELFPETGTGRRIPAYVAASRDNILEA